MQKHKKLAGQHIVLPDKEKVSLAVEQGYNFLALGMDTVFVAEGSKKYWVIAAGSGRIK